MRKLVILPLVLAAIGTSVIPAAARTINVWGNNFTVDDYASATAGVPASQYLGLAEATDHNMRQHRRHVDLMAR